MAASKAFDNILQLIQASNLNFKLQLSPFSANISLKKSPVTNKSGLALSPPSSPPCPSSSDAIITALTSKNLQLESALESLKADYENAVQDCVAAHQQIKVLEAQPQVKAEPEDLVDKDCLVKPLNVKIEQLSTENETLQIKIENQNENLQDLEQSCKKSDEISKILNKQISDLKADFKKEKKDIMKEHKAEVKAWRLDLGEETRQNVKLKERLNNAIEKPISEIKPNPTVKPPIHTSTAETSCSICASPIANYVPKYFHGERFSPACENCDDKSWISDDPSSVEEEEDLSRNENPPFTPKGFNHRPTLKSFNTSSSSNCSHTSQCIIRQPFPPPIPALLPIVNEYSLYHQKIMVGELDWGSTCWYCMRIEYEKYGCDSCVWIKCFGELHGYPDVHPSDYKKHL